jgi:hypothetical protein
LFGSARGSCFCSPLHIYLLYTHHITIFTLIVKTRTSSCRVEITTRWAPFDDGDSCSVSLAKKPRRKFKYIGRTTEKKLRGNHTIFQIVNGMINRIEDVPLSRAPPIHTVHDSKASPTKLSLFRNMKSRIRYTAFRNKFVMVRLCTFAGQSEVISVNQALQPLHEDSMAPCIREPTRPRCRLNQGEEPRNKSLE